VGLQRPTFTNLSGWSHQNYVLIECVRIIFGLECQLIPRLSSSPLVLDVLDTPELSASECPRRARMHIDLLLLAIEALDLGGGEAMLAAARDLSLNDLVKGRVHLWLLRSTNPMRRYSQRRPMSLEEAKALVVIISNLSRRLTVLIRQLLAGISTAH
jgi:hypothetical protein